MAYFDVERRRQPRYPLAVENQVELEPSGERLRAMTENISECGVLLRFDREVALKVGDELRCEFALDHDEGQPLHYWSRCRVVRVEGTRVAVDLLSRQWQSPETTVPLSSGWTLP